MSEKVFLRLFSVGLERSLEYSLEAGGSCGFSWCLEHSNNAYEIVRRMGDVVNEGCEHWAKGVHCLTHSRFPKASASANDDRHPCPAGRKRLTQPEVLQLESIRQKYGPTRSDGWPTRLILPCSTLTSPHCLSSPSRITLRFDPLLFCR